MGESEPSTWWILRQLTVPFMANCRCLTKLPVCLTTSRLTTSRVHALLCQRGLQRNGGSMVYFAFAGFRCPHDRCTAGDPAWTPLSTCHCQTLTRSSQASVLASCLGGICCGQLSFGYLGDALGRPPWSCRKFFCLCSRKFSLTDSLGRRMRAMVLTLLVTCCGAFGSAFLVDAEQAAHQLGWWRFLAGVGIGGAYPLSLSLIHI